MANVVTFKKWKKGEILGNKRDPNIRDAINLALLGFARGHGSVSVTIRINPMLKGFQLGSMLTYLTVPFQTLVFGKDVEEFPKGTTGFPVKVEYFTEWYHDKGTSGIMIRAIPLIPMLDQLEGINWPLPIAIIEAENEEVFDITYRNACTTWLNNSIIIITD